MILEKLQRLQEPCCDALGGLVSGIFGIGAAAINAGMQSQTNEVNRQIAQETNQANKEIAEATNETNLTIAREANAAAKEEAELAYQRSTASAKIDELVAAGISPQQAKMIVAGQGATGSYTAAPQQVATAVAPTMQTGAPMVAPQLDTSSAATLGQGIGDMIERSYNSPNGGVVGLTRANDAIEFVNKNIAHIPPQALASPYDFKVWLDGMDDVQNPFTEWKHTEAWQKVESSTPAMRAFMYNMREAYSMSADTRQRIEMMNLQIGHQKIENSIAAFEESIKQNDLVISNNDVIVSNYEATNATLEQEALIDNQETIKKVRSAQFRSQELDLKLRISQAKLHIQAFDNPLFRESYFNSMLYNQAAQEYAYQWAAYQNKQLSDAILNDPKFASNLALFDTLDSMGFGNTLVGSRLIECVAAGMSISDFMTKELPAIQQVQQGFESLYKGSSADSYYDAVEGMTKEQFSAMFTTSLKEKGIEFGIDAVNSVVDFVFNLMASKKGRQFRNGGSLFAPYNPNSPYNPSRPVTPLPM